MAAPLGGLGAGLSIPSPATPGPSHFGLSIAIPGRIRIDVSWLATVQQAADNFQQSAVAGQRKIVSLSHLPDYSSKLRYQMSFILKIALAGVVLAALGTAVFLSLRGSDTADTTFMTTLQTKVVPHSGYVIDLPPNYALKENTGPDFSVFYFDPIDTVSIPNFYGGFYLGNYPSRFSVANDSCAHAPLQAPLCNTLEEWTMFDCMNGFSIQAIGATNTKDGWDTYVHAFGHGADDEALHKLVTIFSTLRKKAK